MKCSLIRRPGLRQPLLHEFERGDSAHCRERHGSGLSNGYIASIVASRRIVEAAQGESGEAFFTA